MCNISKKLNAKSVVVYKVARVGVNEAAGKYFSCFSGYTLEVGPVKNEWKVPGWARDYNKEKGFSPLYNENMINRVSGFKDLKYAAILYADGNVNKYEIFGVLKIVLKGDLMEGTGANMGRFGEYDKAVIYAGKEIVSIEHLSIEEIIAHV
jgi:hypothetical protein